MASTEAYRECIDKLEFDIDDSKKAALFNYLDNSQDAATTMKTLLPTDPDPEDTIEWESIGNWIIAIAQKLPDTQLRLIELVKAFESSAGVRFETFGWELRDAFQSAGDDQADGESQNLQEFLARLTVNGYPDKKLYGLWTLRDALEEQSNVNASIPAAAQWMVLAGKVLHSSTDEYAPHGGADPARPGKLFHGNRGFNKERWACWKQAFRDRANDTSLEEETRAWAKKGEEAMASIESD